MEFRVQRAGCDPGGWSVSNTPKQDMGRIIESMTRGRDRANWCRIHHIKGALELASEMLAQNEWDCDKDLCAFPSGDVGNLRTGECRVQRPSDFLTLFGWALWRAAMSPWRSWPRRCCRCGGVSPDDRRNASPDSSPDWTSRCPT